MITTTTAMCVHLLLSACLQLPLQCGVVGGDVHDEVLLAGMGRSSFITCVVFMRLGPTTHGGVYPTVV